MSVIKIIKINYLNSAVAPDIIFKKLLQDNIYSFNLMH